VIAVTVLTLSLAAPVPKESAEQKAAKWGEVKKGQSEDEFKFEGGTLTVRIPSGQRRPTSRSYDGVPRAVRRVAGDFDLSVTVAELSEPAVRGSESVDIDAGLCVTFGNRTYTLQRKLHWFPELAAPHTYLWADFPDGGRNLDVERKKFKDDVRHLRWVRKKDVLIWMASADGKEWEEVYRKEADGLDGEAEVGVFVAQNVKQETTAKFENIRFTGTDVKAPEPKGEKK
jgi:hypothetical protein